RFSRDWSSDVCSSDLICHALRLSERAVPQWLEALVALGFVNRDGSGECALYLNTRETSHYLDRASDAYIGARVEGLGRKVYVGRSEERRVGKGEGRGG